MSDSFPSARHQAALSLATGYRRWMKFTFTRAGMSQELEPTSGSLTQDARRNARWSGSLSFVGDDLLPESPGDILTPFGTLVSAELGIELLDGSISSVPYGTYEVISSSTSISAGSRTVDVSLSDVSGSIERYRMESPLTVVAGTDLADMVNTVVTNRIGLNPGVSSTGSTLGAGRVFGLDTETGPWGELADVLAGFSRVAWYDRVGDIQVSSVDPDPSTAYPLDTLTSLSADFDTRPPNVIVARGEDQEDTAPVQATAYDDDPSSPTYAGTGPGTSPYGRVTYFYASPLITTQEQAQSAADTILAREIGAGATYTMVRPYDPTVTAGDVISFDGSVYVVDSVTISLVGDTSLQVRRL